MTSAIEELQPQLWLKLDDTNPASGVAALNSGFGGYGGRPWFFTSGVSGWPLGLVPSSDRSILINDADRVAVTHASKNGCTLAGASQRLGAAYMAVVLRAMDDTAGKEFAIFASEGADSFRLILKDNGEVYIYLTTPAVALPSASVLVPVYSAAQVGLLYWKEGLNHTFAYVINGVVLNTVTTTGTLNRNVTVIGDVGLVNQGLPIYFDEVFFWKAGIRLTDAEILSVYRELMGDFDIFVEPIDDEAYSVALLEVVPIEPSCLTLASIGWQTEFESISLACPPFQSTPWPTCFESWSQPTLVSKMPCAAPVSARPRIGGFTVLGTGEGWLLSVSFLPDLLAPEAPLRVTLTTASSFTGTLGNAPSDPYIENVILLVHSDAPNGYKDWSQDNRGFGEQHTGAGEAPRFDTAIKKFGASSYYLPGANDAECIYVMGPFSRDPTLVGPFTQEAFVYPVENKLAQIVGHNDGTTVSANASHVRMMANGHLEFQVRNEYTSNEWRVESTDVIPLNEWSHVAVTRDAGGIIRLFIKGILQPNTLSLSINLIGDFQRLVVGGQRNGIVRSKLFHGYIDEARITQNVCRYTANFPEPTDAFPNDPMRFKPVAMNAAVTFVPAFDDTVDPYPEKVSLLLHADGTNLSTAFKDSSSAQRPMSAFFDARHETATKKFGTSGGFIGPGCVGVAVDDPMLDLSTGDFTVEGWFLPQFASLTNRYLFTRYITTASAGNIIRNTDAQYMVSIDPGGALYAVITDAAGVSYGISTTYTGLAAVTWRHIALTRFGNRFSLFADGVEVGSITQAITLRSLPNSSSFVGMVNSYNGYGSTAFLGWFDEFRITKGFCRWTGNFTPPTKPFPTPPITFALSLSATVTFAPAFPGYVAPAFIGARCVSAAGYTTTRINTIDTQMIATPANFAAWGNLLQQKSDPASGSNGTRGIIHTGYKLTGDTNEIEYKTIATSAAAATFGTATISRDTGAGVYSSTRTCVGGGERAGTQYMTNIDYVTTATLGNAIVFGVLHDVGRYYMGGLSSETLGLFVGGVAALVANQDDILQITIATLGNTTVWGTLSGTSGIPSGTSDGDMGFIARGTAGSGPITACDKITIATLASRTAWGNLVEARWGTSSACSPNRRIVTLGGYNLSSVNTDTVEHASLPIDAVMVDFGNLTLTRRGTSAFSGA